VHMFSLDTLNRAPGSEVKTRTHRWAIRLMLSVLFAGFTGLCAQIRFYLPFTPVPVTGQVFAVLLSGVVLGKRYGPLSQIFYLLLGIAGIPWFVVGPIGPTGGYIVGFILAPYLIGELYERLKKSDKGYSNRRVYPLALSASFSGTLLSMLAGVGVIYLLGLIQFSIFTHTRLIHAVRYAVLPFIPFDVGKALLAALLTRTIIR